MAGISHTVLLMSPLELAVDVEIDPENEKKVFTISMGTGFTSGRQASVNIETPRLTKEEFLKVIEELREALKLDPSF